ncbi:AMP-binding protein [Agromyces sp. SYSU K20354]|uniref:AMP-binding protein n=1 Tax=Agromyces cavernae TaxID=2898659 RepID=UPI001E5157B1|nr:AMP-binding protein [Agromyces cavernae]MCD2443651.1 AMP-binding protein [Agromyces cavernae]
MADTDVRRHADEYRRSIESPDEFWLEASALLDWRHAPERALDDSAAPIYRWFPDGILNVSENALDRWVAAGRGDQVALAYDSAMTGSKRTFTYRELLHEVALFAGVLRNNGVEKGDRVAIYLPMTPEAVIAMLACARIGAVHSVVFGGFAANELAVRIQDSRPRVIVTSSGGLEPGRAVEYLPIIEKALAMIVGDRSVTDAVTQSISVIPADELSVETVIVRNREAVLGTAAEFDGRVGVHWSDWDEELADAEAVEPVAVAATDALYVLYTSGTTGTPKGVVRDSGGYAVALAWSMKNIYNVDAGDVMWTASDVGWVVGHSYIVYGPLLAGATTVLYEGKPIGTPDAGAFWRVVEEYGVKVLFSAPTAVRAIRRVDPDLEELARYDTTTLDAIFLAGERLDTETYHWLDNALHCPVIDHWWQTETGWAIVANPRGIEPLPVKPGSPSLPVPGYRLAVVDGKGRPVETGVEGNIVLGLPLPPGSLPTLWSGDEQYVSSYLTAFPGFYATGDSGYLDEDGYVYVMGRTDDVINVAGHRLSTGTLEEAINHHPAVAEVAVIGVKDELKGQRAAGFVTLKHGTSVDHDTLAKELVALVRDTVGPVAAFRDVTVLERLPKTRSGKILRKTMRQIADGEAYKVPATIEDPTVLEALKSALAAQ